MASAELPRLLAVFLVVFDDLQGGKVAFEVPEGSVVSSYVSATAPPSAVPASAGDAAPGGVAGAGPASVSGPEGWGGSSGALQVPPGSSLLSATAHIHRNAAHLHGSASNRRYEPLFDLSDVEQYILPRRPLVKHLVTICVEQCKVLGFPVWIDNQLYPRGRFMYNVCFAFERNAELTAYEPVVRKTGRVLRHMEETTFLLSNPENELRLHSILEQIYEDLGSYSETSVLLDDANTLDLKLFPQNPNPAVVRDWDIPVALGSLQEMRDESWDITMYSLAKLIDGACSVKRLASMADIDLPLARECIQHLLFYGCIILHDLFQYTNSYALIDGPAGLSSIVHDDGYNRNVQAECESYVSLAGIVTPFATLFKFYAKLRPALTLEDWIVKNRIDTSAIDIRRLVSFGLIKGFLRRVEVFPIWLDHPSFRVAEEAQSSREGSTYRNSRGRNSTARVLSHPPSRGGRDTPSRTDGTVESSTRGTALEGVRLAQVGSALQSDDINRGGYPASLPDLLDGEHSSDELCVRYRVSFRRLLEFLRKIGHTMQASGLNSAGTAMQSPYPAPQTQDRNQSTDTTSMDLGRVVLIYV